MAKTHSKLNYTSEQGYVLVPSEQSFGYYIFIPTTGRVVDSSNYAIIRDDIKIDKNTDYDDSIFDDIITELTGSLEPNEILALSSIDPTFTPVLDTTKDAEADIHNQVESLNDANLLTDIEDEDLNDLEDDSEPSLSSINIEDDNELPLDILPILPTPPHPQLTPSSPPSAASTASTTTASPITTAIDVTTTYSPNDSHKSTISTQDSNESTLNSSSQPSSSQSTLPLSPPNTNSSSTTTTKLSSLQSLFKKKRDSNHPLYGQNFYSNHSTLGGRDKPIKGKISKKKNL